MQSYSRLIGIDVGTKRVGIAQTDLLKTFATPVGTFPPKQVFFELKKLVNQSTIDAFIIGWPLTAKGELGKATDRVNSFIEIKKAFF